MNGDGGRELDGMLEGDGSGGLITQGPRGLGLGRGTWQLVRRTLALGEGPLFRGFVVFRAEKEKATCVPIREIGHANAQHSPLLATKSVITLIRFFSDARGPGGKFSRWVGFYKLNCKNGTNPSPRISAAFLGV